MPLKNHFRHQSYHSEEPQSCWRTVDASFPAQSETETFGKILKRFDEALSTHVDAVWLVHGTFAGHDALGWFGQLERLIPAAGPVLKSFGKKLTDLLAGDSGNFTPTFLELFDIGPSVRRFVWSGENTHSGRCKAAIELLDELLQRADEEERTLLFFPSVGYFETELYKTWVYVLGYPAHFSR